ncbi:MAG: RsmE family RNA methyltransferase [Actinomycetota bacterium]|nr:RsmE family RNA methyltransferase [Actinomycetota bacterium]
MDDPAIGAGSWLREHPLAFVEDLEVPELDEVDYHHFSRSLRLRDGEPISVSDGRGRWRPAHLGRVVEASGPIVETDQPAWPITVAFAPVKAQRPEWIVQKLTELGVDHIVPLRTERSVVRWDADRAGRQSERWAKTIREAAMQCRQVRLPSFDPVTDIGTMLSQYPHAALADPEGRPVGESDRTLLIGPEGGWGVGERLGGELRSLPGGILRAETASIVAAAMLVHIRKSGPFTLGG